MYFPGNMIGILLIYHYTHKKKHLKKFKQLIINLILETFNVFSTTVFKGCKDDQPSCNEILLLIMQKYCQSISKTIKVTLENKVTSIKPFERSKTAAKNA